MEPQDRAQKVQAGKEKFLAFKKKRHKRWMSSSEDTAGLNDSNASLPEADDDPSLNEDVSLNGDSNLAPDYDDSMLVETDIDASDLGGPTNSLLEKDAENSRFRAPSGAGVHDSSFLSSASSTCSSTVTVRDVQPREPSDTDAGAPGSALPSTALTVVFGTNPDSPSLPQKTKDSSSSSDSASFDSKPLTLSDCPPSEANSRYPQAIANDSQPFTETPYHSSFNEAREMQFMTTTPKSRAMNDSLESHPLVDTPHQSIPATPFLTPSSSLIQHSLEASFVENYSTPLPNASIARRDSASRFASFNASGDLEEGPLGEEDVDEEENTSKDNVMPFDQPDSESGPQTPTSSYPTSPSNPNTPSGTSKRQTTTDSGDDDDGSPLLGSVWPRYSRLDVDSIVPLEPASSSAPPQFSPSTSSFSRLSASVASGEASSSVPSASTLDSLTHVTFDPEAMTFDPLAGDVGDDSSTGRESFTRVSVGDSFFGPTSGGSGGDTSIGEIGIDSLVLPSSSSTSCASFTPDRSPPRIGDNNNRIIDLHSKLESKIVSQATTISQLAGQLKSAREGRARDEDLIKGMSVQLKTLQKQLMKVNESVDSESKDDATSLQENTTPFELGDQESFGGDDDSGLRQDAVGPHSETVDSHTYEPEERTNTPTTQATVLEDELTTIKSEHRRALEERGKALEEKEAAERRHAESSALVQTLMAELEEARRRQGTPMPSMAPPPANAAGSPAGSSVIMLSARSSRKGSPGFGADVFGEDSSSEECAFKEFTVKLESLRSELEESHGLQLLEIKDAMRREHEVELDLIEDRLAAARRENYRLQEDKNRVDEDLLHLQRENAELAKERKNLENRVKNWETSYNQLRTETLKYRDEVTKSFEGLRAEYNRVESSLTEERRERETLKTTLSELTSTSARENELRRLEREKFDDELRATRTAEQEARRLVEDTELEMQKHLEELKVTRVSLEAALSESAETKARLNVSESEAATIEHLQLTIESLREEVVAEAGESLKLRAELETVGVSFRQSEAKVETLKREIAELRAETRSRLLDCQRMSTELKDMSVAKDQAVTDSEELRRRLEAAESEKALEEATSAELKERLKKAELEAEEELKEKKVIIERLKQELHETEMGASVNEREWRSRLDEVSKAQTDHMKALEEERRSSMEELTKAKEALKDHKVEYVQMLKQVSAKNESNVETLKKSGSDLQQRLDDMVAQLDQSQERVQVLLKENITLKENIKFFESCNSELEENFEEKSRLLNENLIEIKKLQDKLKQKGVALEEAITHCKELEEEKGTMKEENRLLDEALKDVEGRWKIARREMEEERRKVKEEKRLGSEALEDAEFRWKGRQKEMEDEKDVLKEEIRLKNDTLEKAEARMEKLQKERENEKSLVEEENRLNSETLQDVKLRWKEARREMEEERRKVEEERRIKKEALDESETKWTKLYKQLEDEKRKAEEDGKLKGEALEKAAVRWEKERREMEIERRRIEDEIKNITVALNEENARWKEARKETEEEKRKIMQERKLKDEALKEVETRWKETQARWENEKRKMEKELDFKSDALEEAEAHLKEMEERGHLLEEKIKLKSQSSEKAEVLQKKGERTERSIVVQPRIIKTENAQQCLETKEILIEVSPESSEITENDSRLETTTPVDVPPKPLSSYPFTVELSAECRSRRRERRVRAILSEERERHDRELNELEEQLRRENESAVNDAWESIRAQFQNELDAALERKEKEVEDRVGQLKEFKDKEMEEIRRSVSEIEEANHLLERKEELEREVARLEPEVNRLETRLDASTKLAITASSNSEVFLPSEAPGNAPPRPEHLHETTILESVSNIVRIEKERVALLSAEASTTAADADKNEEEKRELRDSVRRLETRLNDIHAAKARIEADMAEQKRRLDEEISDLRMASLRQELGQAKVEDEERAKAATLRELENAERRVDGLEADLRREREQRSSLQSDLTFEQEQRERFALSEISLKAEVEILKEKLSLAQEEKKVIVEDMGEFRKLLKEKEIQCREIETQLHRVLGWEGEHREGFSPLGIEVPELASTPALTDSLDSPAPNAFSSHPELSAFSPPKLHSSQTTVHVQQRSITQTQTNQQHWSDERLVQEISLLRREFAEAKSIHARENALLRDSLKEEKRRYAEALQQLGFSEDSGITDFQSVEEQRLNLQQKMAVLQDSNNALLREKEDMLQKLHHQERLLVSAENDSSGRQLDALRSEREFLLKQAELAGESQKTIHDLLNQKRFLEEALRGERAKIAELDREMELRALESRRVDQTLEQRRREVERLEAEVKERRSTDEDQRRRLAETVEMLRRDAAATREEARRERAAAEAAVARLESEARKWDVVAKQRELNARNNEITMKRAMEDNLSSLQTNLQQSYLHDLTSTRKNMEKQHAEDLAKLRKELDLEFSVKENRIITTHKESIESMEDQHRRQLESMKEEMALELGKVRGELDSERRRQLSAAKSAHERQLRGSMEVLTKEHEAAVNELKEEEAVVIQRLKLKHEEQQAKLEREFKVELETQMQLAREEHHLELGSIKDVHAGELAAKLDAIADLERRIGEKEREAEDARRKEREGEMEEAERERLSEIVAIEDQLEARYARLLEEVDRILSVEQLSAVAKLTTSWNDEEKERLKASMEAIAEEFRSESRRMREEQEEEERRLKIEDVAEEREAVLMKIEERRELRESWHLKHLSSIYRRLQAEFSQLMSMKTESTPVAPTTSDDKPEIDIEAMKSRLKEANAALFQLKEEKNALEISKEAMEKSLKIKHESDLMRLDQQHEVHIEKISKHFEDKINKLERERDNLQKQIAKLRKLKREKLNSLGDSGQITGQKETKTVRPKKSLRQASDYYSISSIQISDSESEDDDVDDGDVKEDESQASTSSRTGIYEISEEKDEEYKEGKIMEEIQKIKNEFEKEYAVKLDRVEELMEARVAEVRSRAREEIEDDAREELMSLRKEHVREMSEMKKKDEEFFEEERKKITEEFESKIQKMIEKEKALIKEMEREKSKMELEGGISTEETSIDERVSWQMEREQFEKEINQLKNNLAQLEKATREIEGNFEEERSKLRDQLESQLREKQAQIEELQKVVDLSPVAAGDNELTTKQRMESAKLALTSEFEDLTRQIQEDAQREQAKILGQHELLVEELKRENLEALESLERRHQEELERMRVKADEERREDVQKWRKEIDNATKKHDEELEDAKIILRNEYERRFTELNDTHEEALKLVHSDAENELKSLKESLLEKQKLIDDLKEKHEGVLRRQKDDFEAAKEDLNFAHAEEMRNAAEELESTHRSELIRLAERLKNDHNTQLARINNEHGASLTRIAEQHEAELARKSAEFQEEKRKLTGDLLTLATEMDSMKTRLVTLRSRVSEDDSDSGSNVDPLSAATAAAAALNSASKGVKDAENELRTRLSNLQEEHRRLQEDLRQQRAETTRLSNRAIHLASEVERRDSRLRTMEEDHRAEKDYLVQLSRREKEEAVKTASRSFEADLLAFQQRASAAADENETRLRCELEESMELTRREHEIRAQRQEQQLMQLLEEVAERQRLLESKEAEVEELKGKLKETEKRTTKKTTIVRNSDISTSNFILVDGAGGDNDAGHVASRERLVSDLKAAQEEARDLRATNQLILKLLSDVVHSNLHNEETINSRLQAMVTEGKKFLASHNHPDPSAYYVPLANSLSPPYISPSYPPSAAAPAADLILDPLPDLKTSHVLQRPVHQRHSYSEPDHMETSPDLSLSPNSDYSTAPTLTIDEESLGLGSSETPRLEVSLAQKLGADVDLGSLFAGPYLEDRQKEAVSESCRRVGGLILHLLDLMETSTQKLLLAEVDRQQAADIEEKWRSAEATCAELARERDALAQGLPVAEKSALDQIEKERGASEKDAGEQALLEDSRRLTIEVKELERQRFHDLSNRDEQIQLLVRQIDDLQHKYESLETDNRRDVDNLTQQVEALEKQVRSDKAFMEEQAIEREAEREEYEERLDRLKEELKNHAKESPKAHSTQLHLVQQIEDLEAEMRLLRSGGDEMTSQLERLERSKERTEAEIRDKEAAVKSLERQAVERREELERVQKVSNKSVVKTIIKQLCTVEERLSAQNDILASELASLGIESPEGVAGLGGLLREAFESLRANVETLTEARSIADGKREQLEAELRHQRAVCEDLVEEKNELHRQLCESLLKISTLQSALDSRMLVQSRNDNLGQRVDEMSLSLAKSREVVEAKDREIAFLQQEIHHFHSNVDESAVPPKQVKEVKSLEVTSSVSEIKRMHVENETVRVELKRLEASSGDSSLPIFAQQLLDEKNAEIDHLNLQLERLLRSTSSEENSHEISASFARRLGASLPASTPKPVDGGESMGLPSIEVVREADLSSAVGVEASSLRHEVTLMQSTLEEKEAEVETLKKEVESLNGFQTSLQEDFDLSSRLVEEKLEEIEALNAELNERVEAERVSAEEQTKLLSEMEVLRAEVLDRESVCRNHVNVIAELEEELETLKEEAERREAKAPKEELEARASHLSSQLAEKEATIEALRRSAEDHENRLRELAGELEDKEDELDRVGKELAGKERKLDETGKALEMREEELEKVGKELRKGWEGKLPPTTAATVNSDSTSGVDSPRSVADDAAAIRQLMEDHQTELKRLSKLLDQSTGELDERQRAVHEKEREISRLQEDIHKHHTLTEKLQKEKEESEKERRKAEAQIGKLDELQTQMASNHQREISQLQDGFASERNDLMQQLREQHKSEIDSLLQQLKDQHKDDIESLKKDIRERDVTIKRLQDELARTKDQLQRAKDHRIIRDGDENDPPTPPSLSTHYHSMTPSSRLSVGEVGRQLEDQIHQTEMLDRALVNRLRSRSGAADTSVDADPVNSSGTESGTDSGLEACSSGMHLLLNRVQKEGIRVRRLTEQQKDGSARVASVLPASDPDALKEAWLTEKRMLLDTIASMRELLQKATDECVTQSASLDDWRASYLKSFTDVITKERESLLAELGSQWAETRVGATVAARSGDADELDTLEKKIQAMVDHHQSAMEKLVSLDRSSLLSELNHVRESLNRSQTLLEAEKRKVGVSGRSSRGAIAGPGISNEAAEALEKELRELKRKIELQDFRLTQERAVATDARASLDSERAHLAELTTRLSRERSANNDLQAALEAARDQITRLTVALEKAQAEGETLSHVVQVISSSLDDERSNARNLNSSLSRDGSEISRLKAEIEKEKSRREQEVSKERRNHETLKRSLDEAMESAHSLQVALEMEKSAHNEARRELGAAKADLRAAEARKSDLVIELQKNFDLERSRNSELMAALERESDETKTLAETLDRERQHNRDEMTKQRDSITGLQASLEREKRQISDLSSALERERLTVASMAASLERTKASSKEEAETERRSHERTRESLEHSQLEVSRLEEVLASERLESSALKTTTARLESELKTLEEDGERWRKERETERQEERKRTREVERDREVEREAKKSLERDVAGLNRKISDLESILNENRERELAALQGRPLALSALRTSAGTDIRGERLFEERHVVGAGGDGFGRDESLDQSALEGLLMSNEKLRGEKDDLRTALSQLEDEVWRYRQKEIQPSERVSFERALRDAKSELASLRLNIESTERERRRQQQRAFDADREKLQRLYGKYLRAESFRKALVYQKKYLLLLLGGFQDCEQATLSMIAKMGAFPAPESTSASSTRRSPAFSKFRSAVRTVIAVQRLKFLVAKWQRATSASARGSRAPPGVEASGSRSASAASTTIGATVAGNDSTRQPLPSSQSRRSVPAPSTPPRGDTAGFSLPTGMTPPTKDSGEGVLTSTTFLSPRIHRSSTNLRREDLQPSTQNATFDPSISTLPRPRSVADAADDSDDYIRRLESLQHRLGRMSPSCGGAHRHTFASSPSASKLR